MASRPDHSTSWVEDRDGQQAVYQKIILLDLNSASKLDELMLVAITRVNYQIETCMLSSTQLP